MSRDLCRNQKGFTLIELILVIAILGLLAVAVAPQFVNIQDGANESSRDAVLATVRSAISMQMAQAILNGNPNIFPVMLDFSPGGPCNEVNPCFGNVLQTPLSDGSWSRATNTYTHIATGVSYTYDNADGKLD